MGVNPTEQPPRAGVSGKVGWLEPRRAPLFPQGPRGCPAGVGAPPTGAWGYGPSVRAAFPGRCRLGGRRVSTPEALPLGRGGLAGPEPLLGFPSAQGHEVTLGGSVLPCLEKPRQQVAKGARGRGGRCRPSQWGVPGTRPGARGSRVPPPGSPAAILAWEPAQGPATAAVFLAAAFSNCAAGRASDVKPSPPKGDCVRAPCVEVRWSAEQARSCRVGPRERVPRR